MPTIRVYSTPADSFGTFESTLAALAAEGNPFAGLGLPRAAAKTRPLAAVPDAASAILAAFEMAQPRRAQPAAPSRHPRLTPRPVMSPQASGEEAAVQALLEAARRRL